MNDFEFSRIRGMRDEYPLAIEIPHQRHARLVRLVPPDAENYPDQAADDIHAGDHDLHGCIMLESVEDAMEYLEGYEKASDHRHQSGAVCAILHALIDADDEEEEDDNNE